MNDVVDISAQPIRQSVPDPIDILASELGAVAGRIEREVNLRLSAALSDLRQRETERDLRIERLERKIDERVGLLKDGEQGAPGERGPQGDRGIQGEQGDQGSPGERGPPGPEGAVGRQGPKGDSGERGDVGVEGPVGPKGPVGERGEPGPDGKQGAQGVPGPAGPPGSIGERGERGERGEKGEMGPRGLPGADGLQGVAGARGETGPAGGNGPKGDKGDAGDRGPAGRLEAVKAWEPNHVFYEGDVVTHEGSTYQALQDTSQTPPGDHWCVLAARGIDSTSWGIPSTHDPSKSYRFFDVVMTEGSSFLATKDIPPGPCPGPGWRLIASAGSRGRPGLPGSQGPRGERGEVGPPGPSIVGWDVDARSLRATPIMKDGSRSAPLDLTDIVRRIADELGGG